MAAQNLRIPGPTSMPESVRAALANQMINHRGAEFKLLLSEVRARLAGIFATQNEMLVFTASGTGGLEAAIVNLFSPGDRALMVVGGAFGERAATIAQAFGVQVQRLEHSWGSACSPNALRDALRANPDVKVVYLTHNETSTGVTNPVGRLAQVIHEESKALIMVDAISGIGALPFETDAWGIDVVVSASQKSFGCPPGLTMISVSPKAWDVIARSRMPRFYWDFQRQREAHNEGSTPFTPAISVFYGLSAALDLMDREGAAARYARHQRAGDLVRNAVLEMGLGLFADPPHNSNVVTAVTLPDQIAPKDLRDELRNRYNTVIGGGIGPTKDTVVRIGHMGFFSEEELSMTLEQIDTVVKHLSRS